MSKIHEILGFGFIPSESEHHFLVDIPKNKDEYVLIYESFRWQEPHINKDNVSELNKSINKRNYAAKIKILKSKWIKLEEVLKVEFNKRLKQQRLPSSRWRTGQVLLERLFGKEMLLLAWAIEDIDESEILNAIRNWLGLSPEERWWLFTMTNASTGGINDKNGWRKAVRYALAENPVDVLKKETYFL